jgi:hypothetical protein
MYLSIDTFQEVNCSIYIVSKDTCENLTLESLPERKKALMRKWKMLLPFCFYKTHYNIQEIKENTEYNIYNNNSIGRNM